MYSINININEIIVKTLSIQSALAILRSAFAFDMVA